MTNIRFDPWVGKFYADKGYNGKKILVLGESHYCKNADYEGACSDCLSKCPTTSNVVKSFLDYKNGTGKFMSYMNTYTKFTNRFFIKQNGAQCGSEETNNFWNSIVFYEYVQEALEKPRAAPTQQMFKNSEAAFFEVIEEYSPDVIFIWGYRLSRNMPKCGRAGEKKVLDEHGEKFYYYKTTTKDIPTYSIPHPSSSYFTSEYGKYLQEVMRLV